MAGVTPALNEAVGANNWKVDIENPDKVLTVTVEGTSAQDIIQAVQKAGFAAEVRA